MGLGTPLNKVLWCDTWTVTSVVSHSIQLPGAQGNISTPGTPGVDHRFIRSSGLSSHEFAIKR